MGWGGVWGGVGRGVGWGVGMPFAAGTVTLILNPAAGRAPLLKRRMRQVEGVLAGRGCALRVVETTAEAGSGARLAEEAAALSVAVMACGGDGTVHDVVQGVAHTGVPLGVLPLGTANALARNLDLPLEPLAALERLLTYEAVTVPLGEVVNGSGTRLFVVMAGCGPDGALVHALTGEAAARFKARLGRSAYYLEAARLFLTRRWPPFEVEYRLTGAAEGEWITTRAAAVMASRVADLGGVFSGLTPRSRLTSPGLQVHLLRTPAHVSFAAWFTLSRMGLPNPWLRTVEVEEICCSGEGRVYAQADAEPLGGLPVKFRVVPAALSLLMPASSFAGQGQGPSTP